MNAIRSAHRDQRGFTLSELLVTLSILGLVLAGALGVQVTGTQVFLTGENQAESQQASRTSLLMAEDLQLVGYGYPPSQKIIAASATAITFWADLLNASAFLTTDATQGSTTFDVDDAAGLAARDTIWLSNGTQWESLTIASVSGNTITVTTPILASSICVPPVIAPCGYLRGGLVGRPRRIVYSWDGAAKTISKDFGDGTVPQTMATGAESLQLRYFNDADVEIPIAALATNLANIRRISIAMTARSASTLNGGTFTIASDVRLRNL
jgi:prepilin-type N-terminal cleavage/methylation domain-containing protein